mmetsp:Transcript_4485/g.11552  ORF Transcript_4485/g.11552 Transcript_4485/m.11552 type:complete len:170 (+) Transcript_4485:125-634(+)
MSTAFSAARRLLRARWPPTTATAAVVARQEQRRRVAATCGGAVPVEGADFPVAIVGAGPTGLTLSLLLSKLGIKHVVFERAHRLTEEPQAHFINHRTMEVFRGIDNLADEVRQRSPPLSQWRAFIYCSAMLQHIYHRIDHFPGQGARPPPPPPPPPHSLSGLGRDSQGH